MRKLTWEEDRHTAGSEHKIQSQNYLFYAEVVTFDFLKDKERPYLAKWSTLFASSTCYFDTELEAKQWCEEEFNRLINNL